MKTIKLYNNGQFYFANLVTDKEGKVGRCGPEDNSVYKYEVEIKGTPEVLNDKCFVLDVNEVDKYFQEKYSQNKKPVTLSCELIVLGVLDGILELLEDCKKHLVSVKVRIRATPYSHFEAEWIK